MKIVKRKEKDEKDSWTIKVYDDHDNLIGIVSIGRWFDAEEPIETWNQNFKVHAHNLKGNWKVSTTTNQSHIAIYPKRKEE